MKHLYKSLLALCAAVIMMCTVFPTVAAQEAVPEESTVTSISEQNNGERAYDLVWKYKSEGGHMYKRRWNNTLNGWYDPAWILVY
jgi:hypothetical protein